MVTVAPQQGAQAGQQLPGQKRLGQIIVRAAVQSRYLVVQLGLGRQQQNRRAQPLAAQLPCHLKAAFLRQHHVQHQNVINAAFRRLQPRKAVAAPVDLIALLPQQLAQRLRHAGLILYQ